MSRSPEEIFKKYDVLHGEGSEDYEPEVSHLIGMFLEMFQSLYEQLEHLKANPVPNGYEIRACAPKPGSLDGVYKGAGK